MPADLLDLGLTIVPVVPVSQCRRFGKCHFRPPGFGSVQASNTVSLELGRPFRGLVGSAHLTGRPSIPVPLVFNASPFWRRLGSLAHGDPAGSPPQSLPH